MANDANKLAWKGTPGPWILNFDDTDDNWYLIGSDNSIVEQWVILNIPDKANADMASTAPEAVEFIADLLHELQNYGFLAEPEKWIDRGEQITKKAYHL